MTSGGGNPPPEPTPGLILPAPSAVPAVVRPLRLALAGCIAASIVTAVAAGFIGIRSLQNVRALSADISAIGARYLVEETAIFSEIGAIRSVEHDAARSSIRASRPVSATAVYRISTDQGAGEAVVRLLPDAAARHWRAVGCRIRVGDRSHAFGTPFND